MQYTYEEAVRELSDFLEELNKKLKPSLLTRIKKWMKVS